MTRNIYFGGSVFFVLLFLALTYHTEKILPERTNEIAMSTVVVRGKLVQEQNNCVGCHTLFGEGAYFAPELGNMIGHHGGEEGFNTSPQAWMKIRPLNVPGYHAMPQFRLNGGQVDGLAELLKRSLKVDTNRWLPNKES